MTGGHPDERRLWLVRHAPVAGPRGVIHAPDAPVDLSDAATFAGLRALLPAEAAALASPAHRTAETARTLGLAATLDPRLREQLFGDWTGRRHDDLAREFGAAYHDFWADAARNRPPAGESFVDQIDRVRAALDDVTAADAVLVVHSGTVRAALAIALAIDPKNALSFVIDPLSLTRIDRVGGGFRVVFVNRAARA
jgi:alpha-ribazole phosphatase